MTSRRPSAPRALARPVAVVEPGPAPTDEPAAERERTTARDAAGRRRQPHAGSQPHAGAQPRTGAQPQADRAPSPAARRGPRGRWARPASRPERGAKPRPERRPRSRAEREDVEARPPRTITIRGVVLALVVLVAFVVLWPTGRAFIAQTEQQRRVEAQRASVAADVERLEDELGRWSDASYVQAQARQRLGFVVPGEAPYRVVDPETVPTEDGQQYHDLVASVRTDPQVPWYLTLRSSVAEAGRASEDDVGAAVPVIRPSEP